MPTQVQFRRGSQSQNNNFKGAAGEISVNTDTNSLRVHNGITTGGFELARADLSNVSGISTTAGIWVSGSTGIYTGTKVGIGTTIPRYDLHVIGSGTTALFVDGNARITGILTVGNSSITFDGTNNNIVIGSGVTVYGNTGIVSATAIYVAGSNITGSSGYASTAGIATYATRSGLSTYSSTAGVSTYASTAGIATYATSSGVSTYSTTAGIATYATSSGVSTYASTAGVSTTLTATASVNTTGIITATKFVGDGSGLTNIVSTGAGVQIRDNTVIVGTASTIDFGDNLTVAFGAGIMTVTAPAGSEFVRTSAGIHTLGRVGLGTTNPVSVLSIGGTTGIVFTDSDIKLSISSVTSIITGIVTNYSVANLINSQANQNYTLNNRSGTLSGIGFTVTLYRNSIGELSGSSIGNGGSGFVVGERILIPGNLIGGSTPANDLRITVNGIGGGGSVTSIDLSFSIVPSAANQIYTIPNLSGNLGGTGFIYTFARNSSGGPSYWGATLTGTKNFSLYERITVPGNLVGGTSPTDDINLYVTGITSSISVKDGNIFIGQYAGKCNSSGSSNNFIGKQAGYNNTIGSDNNFFGRYNGCSNITGTQNNFFGKESGKNNTTGSWSVFIGEQSGYYNTTGTENTIVGSWAGYYNTTGGYNAFFGSGSGHYNQTGSFNTFLGNYTGLSTSASYKVVIGSGEYWGNNFDSPDTTKDKQLAIGVRTDANAANYWLIGDENFNIGIGTITPTEKLTVGGSIQINDTTVYGSVQASTASTIATGIHSGLSTSVYRSVEYTIQATRGTNYQAVKILAIHDGTNAYDTQYGNIYNTEVATFDVDISGGNVRLVAAASSTSTTNYTVNFIATKI